MFNSLRNYSKIIIIIIAVAMVITGALMGYGSYLSGRSTSANVNARYIAQVNDTKITQQDYYSVLQSQASQASQLARNQVLNFKLSVLDSMIRRELILQKAEEMGIEPEITDKDVDDYINKILEAYDITEEELANNLEEQDSSIAELKEDIRKSLEKNDLIEQTREKTYSNVKVSEEEIKAEYEKVHLQVIKKNFGEDKEKARKAIEEALTKIEAGKEFKEVAKEYSDLTYNDGDLGMVGMDNSFLPEDIMKKAFTMEKNNVSSIMESKSAFYVVKVLDKKLAQGEEFKKAKGDIKERLLTSKQNEAFNNWLENVRAEADIEIFDPSLKGYQAYINGNYELAVSELEKALEITPVPEIYTKLAQSYAALENNKKAVEVFQEAIENYPEDWELHYQYGNFLAGQKESDKEKAIEQLSKASELAGDDFMAHYQLYMTFNRLEAKEKAEAEMEIIKELQEKAQKAREEAEKNNAQKEETTTENNAANETGKETGSNNKETNRNNGEQK